MKKYAYVLIMFLISSFVYGGNCTCTIYASDGSSMGGGKKCKNSTSECYQWCDNTYNPSGIFTPTISFNEDECEARCGNIYVKQHSEFKKGHKWTVCTKYKLIFQEDGNLVLYNPKDVAIWNSQTNGKNAKILAMQSDGNLVIYNLDNKPIWSTKTQGNKGSVLAIQDDGNVVIYNSEEKAIWDTKTNGK